jgi:uncharacterized cupin superfamily protein
MDHVTIDDLEPDALGEESDRRRLSDPLGTTDVAINHYRLGPGTGFPAGLHAHMDQEEVFLVLDGEATFETIDGDSTFETIDGEVTVRSGEAIRFAPGEFQSGRNASESELTAVAIGAPRDSEDVRIPVDCPDCGHDNLRLETGGDSLTFVCPGCGTEHVPQDCPGCGSPDLRVTLGERTRTVVVCQDCGAEFEHPPLRR